MKDAEVPPGPVQTCEVLAADDLVVVSGMARGEPLAGPDEVFPDDVYRLSGAATPLTLHFIMDGPLPRVAGDSGVGLPGEAVTILSRYRLMDTDGAPTQLLVLSVGEAGLFALPLAPLPAGRDHTLVAVEAAPPGSTLGGLLCVSFLRGTRITLGDGRQRAVEDLTLGDMVLTRDHGRQPLRWLGRSTVRATGPFAPVVIARGRLGNAADLILGQQHRLFLFQRRPQPGLSGPEVLVQARDLIDGETIYLREGGFADYYSLVFDHHEIIYAEGVPCESLMVNAATLSRLPARLARDVAANLPGVSQVERPAAQADRRIIDMIGATALLPPRRPLRQ